MLILFIFDLSAYSGKKETHGLFQQPFLITSAGQNAEVQLVSVLAKKAGLDSFLSKLARPDQLGKVKTVALVIGTSLKGMGAAGLDIDEEKKRVHLLIREAEKKDIPLLCLHLGGEARRGQLTDEFISAFLPYAKMVIVVKSGNKDGLFTRICQEQDIPLIEVEKTIDVLQPFKDSFITEPKSKSF